MKLVPSDRDTTFLTVNEVCARLKVSRYSVWSLIRSGRLRGFKIGPGRSRWRIPESALAELDGRREEERKASG